MPPFALIYAFLDFSLLFPTICAQSKQHQGMPFDLKIGAFPDPDQLILRDAYIHIHHAMAFPAREMVVVLIPADPVGVTPIRKFDPVQQTHIDQHLNCPEDSRTPQAGIHLLQVVPELLHAEILAAGSQFGQPGGDSIPCLRFTPALFFEDGPDFFG